MFQLYKFVLVLSFFSSTVHLSWATNTSFSSQDLYLTRKGAGNLRLGAADAATPVAQTLSVQGRTGTDAAATAYPFTIQGAQGTGTGAGGSIVFQVAPAGSAGSTPNAFATALTIDSTKLATFTSTGIALPGPSSGSVVLSTFDDGGACLQLSVAGNARLAYDVGYNAWIASSATAIAWSSGAPTAGMDTVLRRDTANTLALRNGTSAQVFNVYNTYTDASNYEAAYIGWSANTFYITPTKLGTGANRPMIIGGSAAGSITFATSGTNRWQFDGSGNLVTSADNAYDIGASGANRPRNLYVGGIGVFGGAGITVAASAYLLFSSRGYFSASADGVFLFRDSAATSFNRLQFGGETSSFPALKRNSTALETKLADDSAYAPHAMQYLDVTDGITAPASATGRARIYVDTADGDLKVIFADGTVKTIVTDT